MLTLPTLDLLLAISESELIEEVILTLLNTPQLIALFKTFPKIKQSVMKEIPGWRQTLQQQIKEAVISTPLAEEFKLYQQTSTLKSTDFYQKFPQLIEEIKQIQSPFSDDADRLYKHLSWGSQAGHSLFIQRWRACLILQTTAIHNILLEQEKQLLLAKIQKQLVITSHLVPIFSENDQAAGCLWDMSKGQLHLTEHKISLLTQCSEFLRQQPELEQLAQLLGRSQTAKSLPKDSTILEPFTQIEYIPDTVPEQVSGLRQSDDILRILPTELAILGIEELEYEFYRRLAEKKLLTYSLQGNNQQAKTTLKPAVHHNSEKQPRGPFIVCVDTSGSMGGFNERCAKAFCLALMRIALADNRQCHIMLFSKDIIHYDLTSQNGLTQAVNFLGQTFRGGTDLAFCLKTVIRKMEECIWKDADAVVISDFIAQRLPDDLIHQIQNLQQHQQHRFHAVSLSNYGKPGIMRIFDYIWRFDTGITSRLLRKWQH
ncbi:ATPase RavA stimulator ViaA [Xenorhabdus innexi]|uniref:Regulatory protein ViaA n=1 Tax=Xenorhabdus innexi TaxID=290109 RepID=A0A1N6MRG2_9GAMM|nr:ATPase RavA stimulator ViaA [Xenorhabdus innexi]PHM30634.1 protoheme IX farnesyltransferase [Xenorhabdus innexi]SIP71426.1 Protein viaA [Xenorhabdus innexi]